MNSTFAIILIDTERHQIKAPDGYDWKNYPAVIVHDHKPYHYVGCVEGTPHYRMAER